MDRYLVQFREDAQQYFRTDCGFRDGQFELARRYVRLVMDTLRDIAEGRVLDAETEACLYRYTRGRAVEEELIIAVFGEPEPFVDVNGSDGLDDDPFVRYGGPDDPAIRYR